MKIIIKKENMQKTLIHVGLHKTGTTFLQKEYFPKIQNVNYYSGSSFFNSLGMRSEHDVFLISREGLSGLPWNNQWKYGIKNKHSWIDNFKASIKNLKQIFPNAHIIIVFRKHGDLVVSLYKQHIQEGGVLKFDEFYGNNGVITDRDLNFEERIDFLNRMFQNVSVLSFEIFKKEGVEYFNNFFRNFELEPIELINRKSNSSISGKKLEMLRIINKYYIYTPRKVQKISRLLKISPRYLIQNYLSTSQSKDSQFLKNKKYEINRKFMNDWRIIEKELNV